MKSKTKKQTFTQKVRSMSGAEIIMAMIKGLKKPCTVIDMYTFGRADREICYGCAATNTICEISGIKFTPKTINETEGRAKTVKTKESFLNNFEDAINELRMGNFSNYNYYANRGKFARIKNPSDLKLPYLGNAYTAEDLKVYEKLAKQVANKT